MDLCLVVDHDPVAALRWNEKNTRTKVLDDEMCFFDSLIYFASETTRRGATTKFADTRESENTN